jgi:1-acyl-sn-glycerol-3-phosphate acyltransferase
MSSDKNITLVNNQIINSFIQFADKNSDKELVDILKLYIDEFAFDYHWLPKDLKRIPKEGATIIYSNHSSNYFHYLYLLYTVLSVRDDIKIIVPKAFGKIKILLPFLILRERNEKKIDKLLNTEVREKAKEQIKTHGLVISPSFTRRDRLKQKLIPKKNTWEKEFLSYIKYHKVEILPLLVETDRHIIRAIAQKLFFNQTFSSVENSASKVNIRIGKAINTKDLINKSKKNILKTFLSNKLYALKKDRNKFGIRLLKTKTKLSPIKEAIAEKILINEINQIPEKDILLKRKNFTLFLISVKEFPNIITEIGRLREITFREVGEGTGKPIDLDQYDYYYQHMFIWDNKTNQIVGSYRVGFGKTIFEQYGAEGFYTNELFHFTTEMEEPLKKTIELGRSFIRTEYQKHPLTLMFLWQGILELLVRNPDHQYLFGAVSISNSYSRLSKEMMVYYLKENFSHPSLSKCIFPKNPFKIKKRKVMDNLIKSKVSNMQELDDLIDEIDRYHSKVPVLIKRYLEQNAKVLCFNVDPNFQNCLDALVILDFEDLPEATLEKFKKVE